MSNRSVITGIGIWLPETIRYNDAWPKDFAQQAKYADRTFNDIQESEDTLAAAITARDLEAEAQDPFLGCLERRIAEDQVVSSYTEAMAGLQALEDAGIDPKDVDLVISNAACPDRVSPPSATDVIRRIGATKAMGIGMDVACASSVVQMQMAHAYLQSGQARHVLLTQSHLMTRTLPLSHPAMPGLGDGSSAFVMSREGKGLKFLSAFGITHGEYYDSVCYLRPNDDQSWWKAGEDFRLGSKNPAGCKYLMRETVSFGARTIEQAAKQAGIEISSLDTILSVQPRGFVPGAIAERLGLSRAHAVTTYKHLAHLGTAGPLFNLFEARKLGKLGERVAIYGQGLGFTRFATILTND